MPDALCAKGCGEPRLPTHAYCREHRNAAARARRSRLGPDEAKRRERAYRAANPNVWRRNEFNRRLRKYGVSEDYYLRMWAAQRGLCVCGSPLHNGLRDCAVDHSHSTGEVRGLLCFGCNIALGHVQDSALRLRQLADYLERKGVTPT